MDFDFIDANAGNSKKKPNNSDYDFTQQDTSNNLFIKNNGNQTNNIINI